MVIELDDEKPEKELDRHEMFRKMAEKLKDLAPPPAPGLNLDLDLKSIFIAAVGVAMCVGKSPLSINPPEIKKMAFTLGNRFFDPDGSFTE